MPTEVNPFEHRKPSDEQVLFITILRATFAACWESVLEACPASRYRSLAITALEDSCQWAVKSIVFAETPPAEK